MLENHLDSIPWISLTPQEPDYLFIPQDEELKKQYDKGISVKDIFVLNGVGICSKRDHIVFHNTKEELLQLLNDFSTKPKEELYHLYNIGEDSGGWKLEWAIDEVIKNKGKYQNFIYPTLYRPFDIRYTYYTNKNCGFMARPVYDIFEHFIDKENLGLNVARQFRLDGKWSAISIIDSICDLSMMGGGNTGAGTIFPLYLYPTERSKTKTLFDERIEERVENFTPDFREKIDSLYQEHFSPEVILGYLYAVLFHKRYREQYVDFLKIDFPKIPLIEDKSIFLLLSDLGQRLIALHLLKSDELDSCIGEPLYESDKNPTIEQSKYVGERIIINSSLYFDKVSPKVWDYKIGGYQVLDKYLKSHKGEQIDYNHFQQVIQTLSASLEIEEQIAKIDIGI